MILVIGPSPGSAATRIELGHFAPMRWSPWRDSHVSVRSDGLTAFTAAIQEGDQAGAMQALAASSDALLREARQLSADASAVMSEVLITLDGVAGSAAGIFAILLHEAVHAVAFERGIKDTSRQGRYHNARFRAIAEELGLEAGRDAPFGWSSTALATETTALYLETLRALTEALGDHRDHSTALGDARARRSEVTLMCGCGHRVRPAHRQSIREAICTRRNQRDAHHCIWGDQAWTLASGEAERFPERSEDSNFRRFGPVELRRPGAGTSVRRCAAMPRATAWRKGRRPTSFAFSSGKRTQSPGKFGRIISRSNDEKSLQIRSIQMQGGTTENRGVPGSSPGLAIQRSSRLTSVDVHVCVGRIGRGVGVVLRGGWWWSGVRGFCWLGCCGGAGWGWRGFGVPRRGGDVGRGGGRG